MAGINSTATTPEELAKQFPITGRPFAVWYDPQLEVSARPWVVNNESGDACDEFFFDLNTALKVAAERGKEWADEARIQAQALAEAIKEDANKNGAVATLNDVRSTLMEVQGTAIDELFGLRALAFAGMAVGEDAIGECSDIPGSGIPGEALETMVRLLQKIADDADRTISKIDILPAKQEVNHV